MLVDISYVYTFLCIYAFILLLLPYSHDHEVNCLFKAQGLFMILLIDDSQILLFTVNVRQQDVIIFSMYVL